MSSNGQAHRPRIGVALGDRNGIGPELVARLLADRSVAERAQIVLVGEPAVAAFGRRATGLEYAVEPRLIEKSFCPEEPIGSGKVSARAGAEVLDQLATLLELAKNGEIDGIVFAPLNKNAMRLGGLSHGDELDFVIERLGFSGIAGELNVLGNLWTSRVTSHVPLRDVAALITKQSVYDAIVLAHRTLRAAGNAAPRLAVAGLNPHAGDGGTYGDEEIREIAPAIERAQAEAIDAKGPFPADTIFVAAMRGDYDAVVSMYHDQGQIAMKLMKFGSGVTVLGGLPIPIATVGHGTAYDIAGKGIARADGLFEAFRICCEMATALSAARSS
ncbi:MAG: 4-hydroxythreonine-4-phosphate dehydrogenase PdxA [Candidatus Eremiobacteraeota bacterium]|nr:4-hydroxythreonine-4-phosphate dehydrogenase PdxA [Candidatus Eremiobacteraeota bacterium]